MAQNEDDMGIREAITDRVGGLGPVVNALLDNPAFSQALETALGARERAVHAQKSAMGALNLPAASDLERLARRVRSLSERLEGIEDGLDRMEDRARSGGGLETVEARLEGIEQSIEKIAADIATLRAA